jgi:hypothetical protein
VTDASDDHPAPPPGIGEGPGGPDEGASRPAGWYTDPWSEDQRRYWTGEAWTFWTTDPGAPTGTLPPPPAAPAQLPPPPPPPPPAGPGFFTGRRLAVFVALGLVVGFIAALLVFGGRSKPQSRDASPFGPLTSSNRQPAPTTTSRPRDPSAAALDGLVVQQSDVGTILQLLPLPRGNQVAGEATLDLCNGTFPSESLRTARLQVAALDDQGTPALSTEAVLYSKPDAAAQALTEVQSVAANCPKAPVTSPVGEPTLTTTFNPPPDGDWTRTEGVDRLAYDITTTDQTGQTAHDVVVYLRRGRVLMGVYFWQPDAPQAAVAGQTSVSGIVGVFAARIAALPDSVVNG